MPEHVPQKNRDFDTFIKSEDKARKGKFPSIQIPLDNINLSNKKLKSIKTEMEKMAAEAVIKNEKLIMDNMSNGLSNRMQEDSFSEPKIHFLLSGLNLQPEIEAELLDRLTNYAKKKGLYDLKDTYRKKGLRD